LLQAVGYGELDGLPSSKLTELGYDILRRFRLDNAEANFWTTRARRRLISEAASSTPDWHMPR
jgi:hypothetical protein